MVRTRTPTKESKKPNYKEEASDADDSSEDSDFEADLLRKTKEELKKKQAAANSKQNGKDTNGKKAKPETNGKAKKKVIIEDDSDDAQESETKKRKKKSSQDSDLVSEDINPPSKKKKKVDESKTPPPKKSGNSIMNYFQRQTPSQSSSSADEPKAAKNNGSTKHEKSKKSPSKTVSKDDSDSDTEISERGDIPSKSTKGKIKRRQVISSSESEEEVKPKMSPRKKKDDFVSEDINPPRKAKSGDKTESKVKGEKKKSPKKVIVQDDAPSTPPVYDLTSSPKIGKGTKDAFKELTKRRSKIDDDDEPEKFPEVRKIKSAYDVSAEHQSWVDKYKPTEMKQIIGQHGPASCTTKLHQWLQDWYLNRERERESGAKSSYGRFGPDDGSGFKAALLSGPPGIGKTTAAHVVVRELGMDLIEFNASDTRSKKSMEQELEALTSNQSLVNFLSSSITKKDALCKPVVIMDEVDGMAGNEDRGGIAELISLIKKTKIPIICICNDRQNQKIRSLSNYCYDLRFPRPRAEQIKAYMMGIAYKEGLKIKPEVLGMLIESSGQDIRQTINYLSLLASGKTSADKLLSKEAIKDLKLSPFDALRKVFTAGPEASFIDRSNLFFTDYSLMPLFVHENYLNVHPAKAKKESDKLLAASRCIDSIAFGGLVDKQIRESQSWSLLPTQATFATILPGYHMRGHVGGMINFPSLLGRISAIGRKDRLLQDLKMHMSLKISGSKSALCMEYIEPMWKNHIIDPLVKDGVDSLRPVIETLSHYSLLRDDLDSLNELTLWPGKKDPWTKVDSKTKAALTRAYNSEGIMLPYSMTTRSKGKSGRAVKSYDESLGDQEFEDAGEASPEEEEEGLDAMIKEKKKPAAKGGKGKKTAASKSSAKTKKKGKGDDDYEFDEDVVFDSDDDPDFVDKKPSKKKATTSRAKK